MVCVGPMLQGKKFSLITGGATCRKSHMFAASAASLVHVCVLIKCLLAFPWGVFLGHFDHLHFSLCVRTIDTQFQPHTLPQNYNTKHYETLVQLRLVFGHHGRFISTLFKQNCNTYIHHFYTLQNHDAHVRIYFSLDRC